MRTQRETRPTADALCYEWSGMMLVWGAPATSSALVDVDEQRGSCKQQLLHLLSFDPPPLCKAASLFCHLTAIPSFSMGKMEFCSLGSARQSSLFVGNQALGGCRMRISFRLYALEEKHLQL